MGAWSTAWPLESEREPGSFGEHGEAEECMCEMTLETGDPSCPVRGLAAGDWQGGESEDEAPPSSC